MKYFTIATAVVSAFLFSHSCDGFQAVATTLITTEGAGSPARYSLQSASFGSPPKSRFSSVLTLFPPMSTASASEKGALNAVRVPLVSMRKAIVAFAVAIATFFKHRILWPGSGPDKDYPDMPLPQGSNGCPFIGFNYFSGSSSYGVGVMFTKLFKRLGRPKLFRFYSFGMPTYSVTGKEAIQEVLKTEFRENGVGTPSFQDSFPNYEQVFGDKSVLYENDREKHSFLRRLVGGAMTPANLVQSVPAIERAASRQIEKLVEASKTGQSISMHEVCNDFTLDVAWRQILGLNLKGEDEIEEFYDNTRVWLKGLFNPLFMMPFRVPFIEKTKTSRAKDYLSQLVEAKVKDLERSGPDDSTLSKMYFATDEDGSTRLTHQELLDNALILILAGSETSSSTLVNCMLMLGLHKDVLKKLQEEQRAYIARHGSGLSKDSLDEDCPYLDGFIRETMRIRPIPSIELRQTKKTIVMDGQQIPKKSYIYNNIRAKHDQDPSVRENDNDDHMDLKKGFRPERWLDSQTTPQEWMPFGMGARRCLGERLAMTEMKVFLSVLVRKIADFDLVGVSNPEEVKWKKISVIPLPDDGVVIRPTAAA